MSLGAPVQMYTATCSGCGLVWHTTQPSWNLGDEYCRDNSKRPAVKGCGRRLPDPESEESHD